MGDAEVDEHRVAIDEQDVRGLDVAVHDVGRVDDVEGLGDAAGEPVQLGRRQRTPLGHVVVEGWARHVASHDVGVGAVDVGVDDRCDPGAADPAQGVDLAAQPRAGVRVVGHVLAEHLDRHGATVPVEGEVHHAHAALTQLLHEAVRAEARGLTRLLGLVRLGAVGEGVGGHATTVCRVAGRALDPDTVLTPFPARDVLRVAHAEEPLGSP